MTDSKQRDESRRGDPGVWGLLWYEWRAHHRIMLGFFATWLICVWIVPVFSHAYVILGFSVLYALVASLAFGAIEVFEGSEEFAFALPSTRRERYVVRVMLGLSTVTVFSAIGVLAVTLNWPQMIWALMVDSGLTDPFQRSTEPPSVNTFVAFGPIAFFSCCFAMAATMRTRSGIAALWLPGVVIAGGAIVLAACCEVEWMPGARGAVFWATWLLATVGAPILGLSVYARKPGLSRPAGSRRPYAWLVWLLAALIVVGLLVSITAINLSRMSHGRTRSWRPRHRPEYSDQPDGGFEDRTTTPVPNGD